MPCTAIAGTGDPFAAHTLAMVVLTMSVPSTGSSRAPSPSHVTPGSASVSTTTSLHRSSANPNESKPGPRFAEVAGTRTVMRIG